MKPKTGVWEGVSVGNDRHKAYFIAALIFVSLSAEMSFML
jgi:hypothetical protein